MDTRRRIPARHGGRGLRAATGLLGTVLLGVAVASAVTVGQDAALDDLDAALRSSASSTASDLTEYFDRARSVELLLAHDSSLRQFEPGHPGAPRAGRLASIEASGSLAHLEALYPGRISEACLIDDTGTELARVVDGGVAPAEDLSTEEAATPFFAPTLRLPAGRVYQSAPYQSPDTGRQVIANSTPMVSSTGDVWGLLHFEVTLASFRPQPAVGGSRVLIVDTTTGQEVLGGERPAALGPARLRALTAGGAAGEGVTVDDQRVVVAPVPVSVDNLNSWAVVVTAPLGSVAWWQSVGPAPVAVALAAVGLLAVAGLSQRVGNRRIREAGLSDELTGLPNRRLLTDRLEQALLMGMRRGTTVGVLLIDLDRFKEVNDTLGHHYGDRLLTAVAERLRRSFRASDTVARLGGDEFAVVLPDVAGATAARTLAEKSLRALHEPLVVDGVSLSVDASVGVALAPQHGSDANELLRAADVAMYEAKENKREVAVYDPALDVNSLGRLALLGDLRRALQQDEFVLHFQPKVDMDGSAVHGVEALVRWEHPERGLVPPAEFIPLAEGTGLIVPLTLHTLELALAQGGRWAQAGYELQVAVNLSPRCLVELELPRLVAEMLRRRDVPARLLRLELTKSTIMADPSRALAALTELRQLGVSISIDDFGTGYSSMSYLRRLPVDELKIDRSFVMDMQDNDNDAVLVRSSIDLGHNLGLTVVAEGVEDLDTHQALARLGCDVVQGFHWARPMAGAELTEWLRTRHGSGEVSATLSPA
ncbi:putative bifunctional diguanylate cyclase/phosphodiesterase [Geodermatophilus sp. URMC 63]